MLLKGRGFGLAGNVGVGVASACIAGVLAGIFGPAEPGARGSLVAAASGATCVLGLL